MFCEKCGAQLPDGAKFCENCGSSTVPGAAPGPAVAVATAAAPSAASLALKKFFSNKRNVIICTIALLLIIAVIVVITVIASQPKSYYLDDCFEVTFSGVDGYGEANIEWDSEKLKDFESKIFTSEMYVGSLRYAIDLDLEYDGDLSNGDKVILKLTIPEDLKPYLAGELKLKKKEVKVSGLEEAFKFDLKDYLSNLKFAGYNGYGAIVTEKLFEENVSDSLSITVYANYENISVYFTRDTEYTYFSDYLYFYTDTYEKLSNGDTVRFTYNMSDDTRESFAENGIIFASTEASVTVSSLGNVETFDVSTKITPVFNGFETLGYMNLEFEDMELDINGNKVTVSNDSSNYRRRVYITITNNESGYSNSIYYESDKYESLSNGDVITFNISYGREGIERECGIKLPESFTYTADGFEQIIDPEIFDKVIVDFVGYNGYGVVDFRVIDGKATYKIGDYTFKLSENHGDYKLTFNVTVENAEGESIISVNYITYNIDDLENGDSFGLRSESYSSTLNNHLTSYGIYFPYEVVYDVEGLSEPTTVNPFDYVEYSFSGMNGYIALNASLTTDSITVNEATINFSIEKKMSWATEYCYLNYEVVNSLGDTVSTGYYRIKSADLYNGDTISTTSSINNKGVLSSLYGIIFDETAYSIIVSNS